MRMRRLRMSSLFVGFLSFAILGLAPAPLAAQTPFVPYFGKNLVRHTKFNWHIYKTDHFEIFYYPEIEAHLERIAAYAENAYQHISAELKHDLPERVPMILFKTASEFQTNNIAAGIPEGVLAFAEPERNRMVLPIDEPPDQLYRLITHELTHVFEFHIIPRGIMGANLPLWVDEGLANYMAGYWNVLDLMQVRDAALSDNVPKMSEFETQPLSGRLPYSMGHATFEFIESKWGKDGLRQFLFSLRKSVIGGGEGAYEEALRVKPDEFDEMFDRYLKERFRPFRDKERPADYGKNLAPKPRKTPHIVAVLSIDPSPSGDMLAAVVGNARDQELDIVLLSAKDGEVIENLTSGFDHTHGYEYIATAGGLRGNLVPWIAWAPVGDTVAYFARTDKSKTLILQNVATKKIVGRFDLQTVDGPESPSFSPDGKMVAFSALQNGVGDIFTVNIATGELTNLTKDNLADYSPAYSPDGKTMIYTVRISGNDKLFQLDLATGQKKQITFGTHDDTAAKFFNASTVVFTSTAIDPNATISQEVARNANIPNVWTLNLANGELKQLTDTMSGNVSPVVLRTSEALRVAFVSYYKGEDGIHTVTADKPIATVASADFGQPSPIIDFQPPLPHTLVRDNISRKGKFQGMTLAGRPPVGLGVTSGGNFYGNTEVTFTDLLGDRQISFYAQSVSQYRTMAFTYLSIENRLQYALQGFSQDTFYFGNNAYLYDPALAPYIDRDFAEAVSSQKGATGFVIYPFNRFTRAELFGGYVHLSETYTNPALQALTEQYQVDQYGQPLFRNGHMLPFGVSLIRETTIFREYGPVSGNTFKLTFEGSPGFRQNWLSRRTIDADLRHYRRLVANGVLALRFKGFKSWGRNPDFMYFGGNSEMRGYDYLEFIGQKAFFANAELRFPLIEAMLTPVGVLGGLRGVFFFNIGGGGFNGQSFSVFRSNDELYTPLLGYQSNIFGLLEPVYGPTFIVSGLRLVDARASYGIGLQSFLLGFPMHFDWSWKTLLNRDWEDLRFAANALFEDPSGFTSGSAWFRKMRFSFWIGYDF
jgi:hypothetical protein